MTKKYAKPPLQEASFEVVFSNKGLDWSFVVPGFLFHEAIKEKFPKKKIVHEKQVTFKIDPNSEKESIPDSSREEIMQFLTEDEKTFIIVKKNHISVHRIKEYISWEEYKESIEFVWSKYLQIVEEKLEVPNIIENISRVGLRYFNAIELKKEENFKIEEYFNYMPGRIFKDKKLAVFLVGTVYELGDDNLIRIELTTQKDRVDGEVFALDIDYSSKKINGDIIEWLEIAHKQVEHCFENTITGKTKNTFNLK